MTINDLIKYCEIRLEHLRNLKTTYLQIADYENVNKIDIQIFETEDTLLKLKNNNNS